MAFLKYFLRLFSPILLFFKINRRKRQEKILFEEIQNTPISKDSPELYTFIEQSTIETKLDNTTFQTFVEHKTFEDLQQVVHSTITPTQKSFPGLLELQQEFQRINARYMNLELKRKAIHQANPVNTTDLDKKVEALKKYNSGYVDLGKKKKDLRQPETLLQKLITELDKLFDNSLLKKHKRREAAFRRKELQQIQQLKNKLGELQGLITKNKLSEAKTVIATLELVIEKSKHGKLLARLNQAKSDLRTKEEKNFKRRQEEILRQQQQAAEAHQIAEAAKKEAERLQREQLQQIQQQQAEEKERKARELNGLLIKRSDWAEFDAVLVQNNINCLYHFTDRTNISSIKKNKGLFSWHYCDQNGISIAMPGGGPLSRNLDREHRLEDYVRLSLVKDHPMMHVAIRDNRIVNPVVLHINKEVCFLLNTRFSDMNAADRRHKNGESIAFFRTLKFHLFRQRYFDLTDIDKKHYQAEVMAKTWIPIEYITNINDF